MAWRVSKRAVVLATALGAVVISLLVWLLIAQPAPEPMPNPNGYDDLVKAGREALGRMEAVGVSTNGRHTAAQSEGIRLDGNQISAAALELARRGMARECRVRPYSLGDYSDHLLDRIGIKQLAFEFQYEGSVAETHGRYGEAARSYLDIVRLGHESTRGGALLDGMDGRTIQMIGVASLQMLTLKLDARTCRDTALALEAIEARREPADAFVRHERSMQRRMGGGLRNLISRVLHYRTLKRSEAVFRGSWLGISATSELAITRLATRAYQLDHNGAQPPNLDALVPQYLKAVPVFPYAVTNQ